MFIVVMVRNLSRFKELFRLCGVKNLKYLKKNIGLALCFRAWRSKCLRIL